MRVACLPSWPPACSPLLNLRYTVCPVDFVCVRILSEWSVCMSRIIITYFTVCGFNKVSLKCFFNAMPASETRTHGAMHILAVEGQRLGTDAWQCFVISGFYRVACFNKVFCLHTHTHTGQASGRGLKHFDGPTHRVSKSVIFACIFSVSPHSALSESFTSFDCLATTDRPHVHPQAVWPRVIFVSLPTGR